VLAIRAMSVATYHLYHHPLDPSSRLVRLCLAEKGVACALVLEKPWEPSEIIASLNPAAEVPVLVIEQDGEKQVLCDAQAICEYMDETHPGSLLGKTPLERAEARRLLGWFDRKMRAEVTTLLLNEKAIKRLRGRGEPDSAIIRAACANIKGHLGYVGWLTERRNWLAGSEISVADLAAGANLSVLDYLGDVPWDAFPLAKEWYARLKSRPAFRSILGDHIPGFPPPSHYANLDF